MQLAEQIPEAWRSAVAAQVAEPAFAALAAFVENERSQGAVFPPPDEVFAALEHVAPKDVRVVMIGQDPYPTSGNANGLAFSVAPGQKIPASLRNLFAGLELDLGYPPPTSGDLTPWARQGVLLLNTVLTVREGAAGSHRKRGWEPVTDAILRHVNALPGPIVFLALGKPAQAMSDALVDRARHHVLCLPHPSPLNGKAFVTAAAVERPFSRINQLLKAGGRPPIAWQLSEASDGVR
jgi:uracil-DNA glycosylase